MVIEAAPGAARRATPHSRGSGPVVGAASVLDRISVEAPFPELAY